jgi:WD40 repeat protein/serine/threonine protein kinase
MKRDPSSTEPQGWYERKVVEPCFSQTDLQEYVTGTLSHELRGRIVEHLHSCADCRRLLSHAAVSMTLSMVERRTHDVLSSGSPAQPPPEPAATPPIVAVATYELEREHARGGVGRVWQARDVRLRRSVAIKELLVEGGSREARFLGEAELTARLQHPSIVPVYQAGTRPDGRPFYAMKFISGRSLEALIAEAKSPTQRLALLTHVIAVAEAIAYAHSQRVIHRDLKPSNIVVGEFGETVVVDWGLGKDLAQPDMGGEPSGPDPSGRSGPRSTIEGALIGTPAFMSPEQARGEPADERSDVYALGALLYNVLAGSPPYLGNSVQRVIEQVIAGTAPRLTRLEPSLPADLAAIVEKAMATDPRARYTTASELVQDLRRFQTGQLVGAQQYSLTMRAQRWLARHRAVASLSTAFVLVLAVFGALALGRIIRERNRVRDGFNRLVLSEAHHGLKDDPAAALAWLKNYPVAAGKAGRETRTIALRAVDAVPARHVFRRDRDSIGARIALSHDGRLVAGEGEGGTTRIWALDSGRTVASLPFRLARGFLAFADADRALVLKDEYTGRTKAWTIGTTATRELPSGDPHPATWLALSSDGATLSDAGGREVAVVDVKSGERVVLATARDQVRYVDFSPDGRLLAAAIDGDVAVWQWRSRALVHRWHINELANVLSFSPDSKTLLLATESVRLHLIDLASLADDLVPIEGQHGVAPALFSPDGTQVAFAVMGSPKVMLLDRATRKSRLLGEHQANVLTLAFTPDGTRLISGGDDNTLRVFGLDAHPNRVLRDAGWPWILKVSPAGYVAALCNDGSASGGSGTVSVWKLPEEERVLRGLAVTVVDDLTYSPSGRLIATTDEDRQIVVWERASARRVATVHAKTVAHIVAFTPDERFVIFGGGGADEYPNEPSRTLSILDLQTETVRDIAAANDSDIAGFARSPDGTLLAAAHYDNTIRLWDLAGSLVAAMPQESRTNMLAFDPRGELLAAGNDDGVVRLWRVKDRSLAHVLRGHTKKVNDVAFSPDGEMLASASHDGTVRLWRVHDGSARVLPATDARLVVAFSRDGRWLASAGADSVMVWNPRDATLVKRLAESSAIKSFAFSPDGKWLAAGDLQRTLRLWETGRWSEQRMLTRAQVLAVRFSPDGRELAWVGTEGVAHLLTMPRAPDVPEDGAPLWRWLGEQTTAVVAPDMPLRSP